MPGQRSTFPILPWPYVEGLRLDEAMHPLTILAVGCTARRCRTRTARRCASSCPGSTGQGHQVDRADPPHGPGAVDLVDAQAPASTVLRQREPGGQPPRWSQRRSGASRRIRIFVRRGPTLPFNGYADQVASLYAGMDLTKSY
jgi:sulfoxide reductase catalytic subunit YedY